MDAALRRVIREEIGSILATGGVWSGATATVEKQFGLPPENALRRLIEKTVTKAVGAATKQVFDRQEAADYLRIKLTTLWDLTKRGLLKPNRATGKPL